MRFRVSAVVALVVVASAACDETSTGGAPSPERDVTISMPGNTFSPMGVTVPIGGKVLWVGSGTTHNVAFLVTDGPSGCSNWSIGDCLRTFPTAGTYPYTCTLHPGMDGVVSVHN